MTTPITAVVANARGEIFDLEGYGAVGRADADLSPLSFGDTRNLPHGSELMMLPDRAPILYNLRTKKLEVLEENPFVPGQRIFPVAAFNSPGFVITRVSGYREGKTAGSLPLFSYGAAGWSKGRFRSACIQVDREPRQDLRRMPRKGVEAGVRRMQRLMPDNRLRAHLEKCALTYGCPAGKNFFLGRYEAPLPTTRSCNARCLGCISLQENSGIPCSQDRIDFTPEPEEIAEVALAHIQRVRNGVVSFGQGCEGDPLMAARVIEPAIRMIRAKTENGTINLNTNGSRPDILKKLFKAGLDSVRVSINSLREEHYNAYFRPQGYRLSDVLSGMDLAMQKRIHVSINYLNCPGFSDSTEEVSALIRFLENYPIGMIQWRNLNYDPLRYWELMTSVSPSGHPIGMKAVLKEIRNRFPGVIHGYFNPPKERFGLSRQ